MSDKSGSPPCGIYIRIDEYADMQKHITALRQMAMVVNRASGYEKNMHVIELRYAQKHEQEIQDLAALMQAEGFVTILSGHIPHNEGDLLGTDGVLLDTSADIKSVRIQIGEAPIIGLSCEGKSRNIEDIVTTDIDYIAFPPDAEKVLRWAAKSEIPVLVSGQLTNDTCGAFVRAGASFIESGNYIFSHAKGVMQGTINMLHAIDLASEMPQKLN